MVKQQSGTIEWLEDPSILIPNKYSAGIYGEDGFQGLLESIKELGILHVTAEGKIVPGHRRWRVAQIIDAEGRIFM